MKHIRTHIHILERERERERERARERARYAGSCTVCVREYRTTLLQLYQHMGSLHKRRQRQTLQHHVPWSSSAARLQFPKQTGAQSQHQTNSTASRCPRSILARELWCLHNSLRFTALAKPRHIQPIGHMQQWNASVPKLVTETSTCSAHVLLQTCLPASERCLQRDVKSFRD